MISLMIENVLMISQVHISECSFILKLFHIVFMLFNGKVYLTGCYAFNAHRVVFEKKSHRIGFFSSVIREETFDCDALGCYICFVKQCEIEKIAF